MQRLVLARSVGHGETGFRLRSSVFATPIGKGPCSALCCRWCRRIRAVEMRCKKPRVFQPCVECDVWNNYLRLIYLLLVVVVVFFLLIQWTAFLCLWKRDRMLHWIWPVPRKWSTCLQDRSCICNAPSPWPTDLARTKRCMTRPVAHFSIVATGLAQWVLHLQLVQRCTLYARLW